MYKINPRELTFVLSEALDFVGIDDTLHGKRVAYMAGAVAKKLGWSEHEIDNIIYMGMLHDCGVSSSVVHEHLVNELDWSESQDHSQRGYQLLNSVDLYRNYALPILYHHTHWEQMPEDLDLKIQLQANLIYLVDRVDALQATSQMSPLEKTKSIFTIIEGLSGDFFAPELVDAFFEVAQLDAFWYYLEEQTLRTYLHIWVKKQPDVEYSFEQVKQMSLLFSAAVDAKSPYTSEHSIGVASLARLIARLMDLSQQEQEDLELAGLFHDLGKLKVPDEIINKPGKLSVENRIVMNRHGFDSNIILNQIAGFNRIAKLAAMHHETLDGKGYPYQLTAEQIGLSARILSVADIFQALVQNRPYRTSMTAEQALDV